jgi:general stress protein 26
MRPLQAEHVVAIAKATLDTAEFCFFTTPGESDPTNTRLMQHFKPDADLTVWFGTSLTSRKVREIRRNPRVTVACQDPQRPAYAVLVGMVTIEERAEQWRRYWREDWQTFWPEGPSGRDYVPLRFTCERVEVLSFAAGIAPAPYGLRAAAAVRHGDGWRLAVDS